MKQMALFFLFGFSLAAMAQEERDNSVNEIEGLFEEEARREEIRERSEISKGTRGRIPDPEIVSDLKKLETFEDIAMIQKRYLPKTGRFEFYAAGGTNLNDAFFVGNGISLRLGYNFLEKWGVELVGSYIQNDNRNVTNELVEEGVQTEGEVSTNSYIGMDLKWTPIYGKYAYFNEKIIPFDLYFTLGGGQTTTDSICSANPSNKTKGNNCTAKLESPYTVRVGTGQIFALTKWMAFRWDLAMHMIWVDSENQKGEVTRRRSDNLFLNIGLSFFFPEAKYR